MPRAPPERARPFRRPIPSGHTAAPMSRPMPAPRFPALLAAVCAVAWLAPGTAAAQDAGTAAAQDAGTAAVEMRAATPTHIVAGLTPRRATARRAPETSDAPPFYVVEPTATMRAAPSPTAAVVGTLRLREGVRALGDTLAGGLHWRRVQFGGTRGYLRAEALSNVWIRVDKSDRTMFLYRGADLVRELPADVSLSDGDKVRRSGLDEPEHWRMPEGVFHVVRLNDESSYYRAFVLSYPNPVHALRGLEQGLIDEPTYRAIVRADADGVAPPMGTRMGGMIEIHGSGSGRREAWTRGCVALRNVHMDDLWDVVQVGTPVVIEP